MDPHVHMAQWPVSSERNIPLRFPINTFERSPAYHSAGAGNVAMFQHQTENAQETLVFFGIKKHLCSLGCLLTLELMLKVKAKLTLKKATKAQRWNKCIALLFL